MQTGTRHGHQNVKRYTLLAVADGDQWSSLCRELDIASSGDTAAEALDTLEAAVRQALAYQRDAGVAAGSPTPDSDLADFLDTRQGLGHSTTRHLLV